MEPSEEKELVEKALDILIDKYHLCFISYEGKEYHITYIDTEGDVIRFIE